MAAYSDKVSIKNYIPAIVVQQLTGIEGMTGVRGPVGDYGGTGIAGMTGVQGAVAGYTGDIFGATGVYSCTNGLVTSVL